MTTDARQPSHASPRGAGARMPGLGLRRLLFWGLVAGTALGGSWMMLATVSAGGLTGLEAVILALFVPTFTWVTIPFWTGVAGFVLTLLRRDPVSLARLERGAGDRAGVPAAGAPAVDAGDAVAAAEGDAGDRAVPAPLASRTALVVPVYNEDPAAVTARLSAMARSLRDTGHASAFHVHLLSDTGDPAIARAEEAAWARLQGTHPELSFSYRRRPENTGRKAGNIREFLERCGHEYDFMVVLDADSLMTGKTLVTLARRMENHPRVGLLQTVPLPVRQTTLFGRLVQFASALYAPPLAAGLAFWQGDTANYWGHNAIVRTDAFTRDARLPSLPGRAPLGGEILSHDFVEAALLRRAGWQVVLDPTLGGSYEELPGTLAGFAARDRRWAQGSLQHLRLVGTKGLHPLNRLHFVLGAMGYVSSLLWLLMLVAGTAYVFAPGLQSAGLPVSLPGTPLPGISLLALTAGLLFVPKGLGLILALGRDAGAFGGRIRLVASAVLETGISVLLAPIMMLLHARFVTEILAGRAVGWGTQQRDAAGLSWGEATRAGLLPTLVGTVWGGATLAVSPLFFLWMSPIFAGLLLAVPLIRITSRCEPGRGLRRLGLLLAPAETRPGKELQHLSAALDPLSPGIPEEAAPGRDLAGIDGVLTSDQAGSEHSRRYADTDMYNAERALFDLQRGRPLLVVDTRSPRNGLPVHRLVASVEALDDVALQRFRRLSDAEGRLVVTPHRARAMGLVEDARNGASPAFVLPLGAGVDTGRILELAAGRPGVVDGVPSGSGLKPAAPAEAAALALTHLGRSLPAVVAFPVEAEDVEAGAVAAALRSGELLSVTVEEADALVEQAGAEVIRISDAPVPLPGAEDSHFILFREAFGLAEHVAILVGDPADWPDPVPVRLHSACLTGDLFGSLRCDCGEQLRGSMAHFASRRGGILLYLAQEGRGIGLSNKFRAYSLQETGLDTIDADGTLGFGADERRYDVAVRILEALDVGEVELLTNNPEKVQALNDAGIRVTSRRPLHGSLNRHNLPYVRAKVNRAGHWLQDMLAQPLAGD